MNEHNDERIRRLLREAVPPLQDPELARDLWPAMLRRLDERPIRASWFDWALIAAVLVWFFVFPEGIPALLYHF